MRILQIIQKKQLRGAEVFASQLSSQLIRTGHDVKIVALQDGQVDLPFNGPIIVLNADTKKIFDLTGFKRLADLVKKFKPDIVQANAGDTFRYAAISRMIFHWQSPLVFRNASIMSRYLGSGIKKRYYGWLLKKANAIVSVCDASKYDLFATFPGLKDKLVKTIPIGIEHHLVVSETVSTEVVGDFILHVGGFTFEKNHAGLLRICETVWKRYPELKLVLAGDGPLLPEIRLYVDRIGRKDNVIFLGQTNEVPSLMKQSKLLVLPSIIEGLPAVIIEAMYLGVPVIAYDTGGVSELVQDGCTGYLIALNDENTFAKSIMECLTDHASVTSMIGNAKDLVNEKYMNNEIASTFVQLYEAVILSNHKNALL